MNDIFSIKRLALLMKLDLCVNYRIILIFIAAITSVLLLYFLAMPIPIKDSASNFHATLFASLLFFGGFWTTSLAFKELHDEKRSYVFLTLPSSNFEKFINKLLLTSLGYVAALTLGYFLLSAVVSGVNKALFHYPQPIFNPLEHKILIYIAEYFVWQSVFLLGSVYFKRSVLSKIALTISSVLIALIIFAFIASLIFIGPAAVFHFSWYGEILPRFITIAFWLFLAPFCWVITYLRLVEAEI